MTNELLSKEDAVYAVINTEPYWVVQGEGMPTGESFVRVSDVTEAIAKIPTKDRQDEEDILKFYYVESIDEYWIGQRIDNFYYARWDDRLGFVWSASRYLPWGEHIVDEETLWKEHTYPSEPKEIPFTEWIVGFVEKYYADRPTWECKDCTHWDKLDYKAPRQGWCYQFEEFTDADEYCSRCAKMRGEEE